MTFRHVDPPKLLDYGPRGGAPLALCWHMAEGPNVSAYLARRPSLSDEADAKRVRGVSVNACVELDGTIVTMVPATHVAGSINPRTIRNDNDDNPAPYDYGARARYAVMGTKGGSDPNRWVYAIEVAGRAVDGPNAKQADAIRDLTTYVRGLFPSIKGALGHRDFQNVKRCPGTKFPWDAASGHGLFSAQPAPEDDEMLLDARVDRTVMVADNTPLAETPGGPEVAKVNGGRRYLLGYDKTLKHGMVLSDFGAQPGKSRGYWVPATATSEPETVKVGRTDAEMKAAVDAAWNAALTEAGNAVAGLKR